VVFPAWSRAHVVRFDPRARGGSRGSYARGVMPTFDAHPLLVPAAFVTRFPRPLAECTTPPEVLAVLGGEGAAPVDEPTDALRGAVRDLLRVGGYKPTGRGKPSSEYLARAVGEGALSSINVAVDVCNAVSLRSGFPISVVDTAKAARPWRVGIVEGGSYVFNPSGQELRLDGLLALHDAEAPCANAVKDAQRTKTDGTTRETLTVVWAPRGHEARLGATLEWYQSLLESAEAEVERL
jgi:hypothetical protein